MVANAANPVSNPTRISSLAWVVILLGAAGFLVWAGSVRARHVLTVSATGEPAGAATRSGQPRVIVPGHENSTYEWLDQTGQMFAQGTWRVRQIDYENAPYGRVVAAASPYRWWLGLLAGVDHRLSGRPLGSSMERAALVADPLLQLIFLVGVTLFVARQFGAWPAALLGAGLAWIFPFAAGFIPGAPGDSGLRQLAAFCSVLPLFIGVRAVYGSDPGAERRARGWFFLAGLAGGCGLWAGPAGQTPLLPGIALGGLLVAGLARRGAAEKPRPVLPWLEWALGGALATFAGYLLEYFPGHLGSWDLRVVHPLYALAWLGGGGLLAQVAAWIQRVPAGNLLRTVGLGLVFAAALLALPVVMWRTHSWGFLETTLPAFRLTRVSGDVAATSLWAWMIHDGLTPRVWSTLLPGLTVLPALWLVCRRQSALATRASLLLALLPVGIAIGFACRQLSWWGQADILLLALVVAVTAGLGELPRRRPIRWAWAIFLVTCFALGAGQIFPGGDQNALDEADVHGLVERDLARWLAVHVGPANGVVLAPHNLTTTLHYYGGLRGLATLNRENLDGLSAAVRILSASTPEEAKELIDPRGVTHIVMPSWDNYLETYTRMGIGKTEGTFYERLVNWRLPTWLKPVPYQLPVISGFDGQSVTVLEVVEDQDDAAALSRTTEYFIEMGELDQATAMAQNLRRFPADLGALTARAQVDLARDDRAGFDRTFESLRRRLSAGADRGLAWDRRASLAVVLARAKLPDLAREQARRCLAEADEAKLRSLTTVSLFRLQVLGKAYGLAITDPLLHELARTLLPDELRGRL